jgi:hypothetical protein
MRPFSLLSASRFAIRSCFVCYTHTLYFQYLTPAHRHLFRFQRPAADPANRPFRR